jgi:Ca2+ transporting ATPase
LFDLDAIRDGRSARALDKYRGLTGLCKRLYTDPDQGISSESVSSREEHYGSNKPLLKDPVTFLELVLECFEDLTLKILIGAAFVSLVVETYEDPEMGWLDGVAILVAIIIVVLVTSINNYSKEKKFQKLNEEAQERSISVLRDGEEKNISVFDLLVGDIAKVGSGDVMPVDALVLWSMKLNADESTVTGECDPVKKGTGDKESPFLLSGSQISDGTGKILVLAVGSNTFLGKNMENINNVEETETPLQEKLNYLAEQIGKGGMLMALLTFSVLLVYVIIDVVNNGWGDKSGSHIIEAFIIAVTIVVVAVPEGLPLAVTLSLAYSVNEMKKKNNLVRHLDASETMGQATNICSDKTGTLTQNIMKVVAMYLQDELFENTDSASLHPDMKEILGLHFCHNTTASYGIVEGREQFTGSRTEIALLKLGKLWGYDYSKLRNLKDIVLQNPFNSELKRMQTIVRVGDKTYLFVKGASEVIVNMCHWHLAKDGKPHIIHRPHRARIEKVISKYARNAFRTLTLAYREIDSNEELLNENGEMDLKNVEKNLILLGIFGIEDPIRLGVPFAVNQCKRAGITVRMVTGDNKETATAIALRCGILEPGFDPKTQNDVVMVGEEFRKRVGELKEAEDSNDKEVGDLEEFKNIVGKLRVLARSSPTDKFILVTGLRQLEEVVAVTGDGSNDAPALKKSNVGFAMHIAGTQLAQEASDIILLDDNFSSIVVAILWGRNIYDSISKFIQFQLTVNVVALCMCFIGAITSKESPLTAVQMLWVNLIMDTFAALALATEPPDPALLKRMPVKKDDSLVTVHMVKTIVGQSIYQLSWLLFILFLFPEYSARITGQEICSQNPLTGRKCSDSLDPEIKRSKKHFTIFFQAFVMMQVFNQVNCRKLKSEEINVFKGFFNNFLFLFIMVVTVVVQFLFVEVLQSAVDCQSLSLKEHVFCLAVGAGALAFGIVFRMVPTKIFSCLSHTEGSISQAHGERSLTTLVRRKTTRARGMISKNG